MDSDIILYSGLDAALADVTGQLDTRSRRIYQQDIKRLAQWMSERKITIETLDRSDVIAYRQFLGDHHAPATAKRMWSVTRRVLNEQAKKGMLPLNITSDIRGFTAEDETTHTALELPEARKLLQAIETSTAKGKRDYAIVSLLLRTGLRRFECSALNIGSLAMKKGHHILTFTGKGKKQRIVKVPVDVKRSIDVYLQAAQREHASPDEPLFTGFQKGGTPTATRISDKLIERLVKHIGEKVGIDISPHGLRASFVTLALEDGAKLEQVQYAVGHSDPRTTERYQKRKLNLDDNAVDHIHL